MKGYRLSVPAQEDLSGIIDYYFEEAGYLIARGTAVEFVEAFRAMGIQASATSAKISPAIARYYSG